MAKKTVKKSSETPLMKQYHQIKTKYPGALLLFRVGDFYETFGEDAVTTSKILDIVLTKRANGTASEIALAGFPHHALDTYLPRMVRAGQRVAICDQLEDPKSVKGIVKRGVTELVTPGVSFNDNVLDVRKNNYLASIHYDKDGKQAGIAFLDISTGEFLTAEGDLSYIEKLLQSFQPSEIIYNKQRKDLYFSRLGDEFNTFRLDEWVYTHNYAYEQLTGHFGTNSLKGFGVENMAMAIIAAGSVLHYLKATEHNEISHINTLSRIEEEKYVWLDKFTIRNLELVAPQQDSGVPLIQILDKCCSPMGARLLKKWVVLPLKNQVAINHRLDIVDFFVQHDELLENVQSYIKPIGDLERLISKVAVGRINPREMVQLKKALLQIPAISQSLQSSKTKPVMQLGDQLNDCAMLADRINKEVIDNPPLLSNLGGIFRDGIDEELDELRKIAFSGKDFLQQILERETERTGIPSLKISYNKVFGYFLEVRNGHKDKVPAEWIRKQTLTSAERYITEELKVYEEKILTAESKIHSIEQRLFLELIQSATDYINPIQQNANAIATLDCLLSFAQISIDNNYCKPVINEDYVLDIKEGRHPVIEQQMPPGEPYIPNNVLLDDQDQQIIVITGPNMAGKSALLRQTALIVLMAQMGCFVPADAADIGLIDKVFTRVGASDNLSKGESTFMVEMTETASIMNNLSGRSLVLMDEIGRGTSTYDGISIAWSIVEYLHNHPESRAKTLFATHYHELNELAKDFPRIKNFNVSVKELKNKIVFLRKLKEGGSEHSFGIHVAQLAGMPTSIVDRANDILVELEKDKGHSQTRKVVKETPKVNYQLSLFDPVDPAAMELKQELENLDINTLTPVEALMKLNELKRIIGG